MKTIKIIAVIIGIVTMTATLIFFVKPKEISKIKNPELSCVTEGGKFINYPNSNEKKKCCLGLTTKIDSNPTNPISKEDEMNFCGQSMSINKEYICLNCGDEACSGAENRCNCPEDCDDDCVPAGKSADEYSFGKYIGPKQCCNGLLSIPAKTFIDGECLIKDDVSTICSDCGNGICEKWENKCNCSNDCKEINNSSIKTDSETNKFLDNIKDHSIDNELNIILGKINCDTKPNLSENQIINISKSSKFKRPNKDEWWEITYSSGSSWKTNPFDDKCIWAVRHYTYYNGGDVFSIAGSIVYIRDSNGEIGYQK